MRKKSGFLHWYCIVCDISCYSLLDWFLFNWSNFKWNDKERERVRGFFSSSIFYLVCRALESMLIRWNCHCGKQYDIMWSLLFSILFHYPTFLKYFLPFCLFHWTKFISISNAPIKPELFSISNFNYEANEMEWENE